MKITIFLKNSFFRFFNFLKNYLSFTTIIILIKSLKFLINFLYFINLSNIFFLNFYRNAYILILLFYLIRFKKRLNVII